MNIDAPRTPSESLVWLEGAGHLVRRAEMRDDTAAVRTALGGNDSKTLKQLMWVSVR